MNEKVRCLIIGSGPAGYTAAIYASRANLSPVLYEGMQPGGQLTTTNEVENFPGYPSGITGTELMEDLKKQAERFGADIRFGMATATDLSSAPYKVRKNFLRASKIMQERVFSNPKIEVLFEHETLGLTGEGVVQGANLVKRRGQADEEQVHIDIDGFFLAIGHKPNSDIFKPWIETDEVGYIHTIPGTPRTNISGVFAAGDVADPHYRQAITAAGTGCQAAIEAERYLSERGL